MKRLPLLAPASTPFAPFGNHHQRQPQTPTHPMPPGLQLPHAGSTRIRHCPGHRLRPCRLRARRGCYMASCRESVASQLRFIIGNNAASAWSKTLSVRHLTVHRTSFVPLRDRLIDFTEPFERHLYRPCAQDGSLAQISSQRPAGCTYLGDGEVCRASTSLSTQHHPRL